MRRHLLVAVAMAALVLLAGCSIPGMNDGTPTPVEQNETSTTTPGTTDGNTTALNEYPNGFAVDGVTDAEAAVGAHKAALLDTGSWVATYETQFSTQGKSQTITETRIVNHTNKVQLQRVNTPFGNQSTYTTASEGWRMQNAYNQTAYSYAAQGYNSTAAVHAPMLTAFLKNVNYTQADTVERDGTTFITYRATGLPEDSEFAQTNNSTSKLENISSTFTVTDEGRIDEFSFSATAVAEGQNDSEVSINLTFENLGSTTVDDPAWLDEAKNNTSETAPDAPGTPTTTPGGE